MTSTLISDLVALDGAGLRVTELGPGGQPDGGSGCIQLGIHRAGPVPVSGLESFDVLLSADPEAPFPWVGMSPDALDAAIADLEVKVTAQPAAASVVAQVFRMTLALDFEQALLLESLAYSMLLGSQAFGHWRAATAVRDRPDAAPRVLMALESGTLAIRLNRPASRNAFDASMRDALCEALDFALSHPDSPRVLLSGEGAAFSSGGDLDAFGQAPDPAEAHLIRTLRAPVRLVRNLGERLIVRLHGACIGAGIEIPAAAARVIAQKGTVCRLPEVSMGLIPGAGGTASIARRIGRHRAAYMAVSGATIDLPRALDWGLVDAEVA